MKKNIMFTFVLLSIILCLNVDAYTYFGDKKATFYDVDKEIGENKELYKYNEKYYVHDPNTQKATELKIENNILIKTSNSEQIDEFAKKLLEGKNYTLYTDSIGDGSKLYEYKFEGTTTTSKEIPIDITNLQYSGIKNDKLYFNTLDNQTIEIYNLDGTLSHELKIENYLSQSDLSDYNNILSKAIFVNFVDGEPLIDLLIILNDETRRDYTFNEDGTKIMFKLETDNTKDFIFPNKIKSNNGYKLIFSECKENLKIYPQNCTVKVLDESNNTIELLSSTGQSIISASYGLITIIALDTDESKSISYIYDNNLNLIKKYDGFSGILLTPIIKDYDIYEYNGILKPNDFLITLSSSNTTKYELMKIENSARVNITGIVIEESGNDLKDYTIELHSIPRIYKIESDGYFKYDNVEEGLHTLIVKNKEGNKIAEKQINLIAYSETKLDGDNLYFNPSDNGVNITIKINLNELAITSVDKGTKEKPSKIENIVEAIIPNIPETSDSLYMYISLLAILIIFSVIVVKNIKRLKK